MGLWALLACSPAAPTLTLPRGPAAEHAEALTVDELLSPTPFGAADDLLCPWALGEPVPDASIARWIAEERLVWRVLDLEAGTFAGLPIERADRVADAANVLDERCGSKLSRGVLVAARSGLEGDKVATGLYELGKRQDTADWYLLVEDVELPTLGLAKPPPPSMPEFDDGRPTADMGDSTAAERLLHVLADPTRKTRVIVSPGLPPTAFDDAGMPLPGLAEAWATHPDCAIVALPASGTWGDGVRLADAARGAGAKVMLGMTENNRPGRRPAPSGSPAGALGEPPRRVALHSVVSVIPLTTPTDCSGGTVDFRATYDLGALTP